MTLMLMQKTTPSEPWKVPEKTPVRQKTLNPTWNHRMIFTIALDSSQAVVAPDKIIAIMYGSAANIPVLIVSSNVAQLRLEPDF